MTEFEKQISGLSYINKDFQTIYAELLEKADELSYKWKPSQSNESDPAVVLLKENALIADKLNYNIDKNILETFPISVSQVTNARALFSELGYNMRWYEGAITALSLRWNSNVSEITFGEDDTLTLPIFTMFTDTDKSIVYTMVDSVTFSGSNLSTIHSVAAIQGIIQDFQATSGEAYITVNNLDEYNRLYFNDYNIAQNGIFINNVGQQNWSLWQLVDSLSTREYGSFVYEFGISKNGQCYIQFPEDIADLIGDGLEIKYVVTQGESGNISAGSITELYNDITASTIDTTIDLSSVSSITTDDLLISNVSSATNGKDPETIEEAYKNYKKTVGTFDTLVTIKDYEKFLTKSELVTNGFVCDRTNDIQDSYKIVSTQKGFEDNINIVTANTQGVADMDAFGLKMYLLQPVTVQSSDIVASQLEYAQGFTLIPSEAANSDTILNYLNDSKSIQHDFNEIEPYKLCMLQNKYAVNCKIIPYSRLTATQIDSLKASVLSALTKKLQSRNMEFGVEVSYDELYSYISDCDERIKSVILDEIVYTTYGIYWDGEDFQEVAINGEAGNAEALAPSKFIPSLTKPLTWSNSFSDYYTRQGTNENYAYTQLSAEKAPTFEQNKYAQINLLVAQPTDWSTAYNTYYGYDYSTNSYYVNSNTTYTNNTYSAITKLATKPADWETNYSAYFIAPNSTDGSGVYEIVTGVATTAPTWTTNTYYIPARVKFRQEIYAKSVLAGRTQFLQPDAKFLYSLYQTPKQSIEDVESISSYTDIELSANDYKVKKNELIQLVAPKLIDTDNFSGYVKFVTNLNATDNGGNDTIPYNTSYKLKANEYIAFFYKQTSENTVDDDIPYTCKCYGQGAIIKPSFTIYNQQDSIVGIPTSAIPTNTNGTPLITSIPYDNSVYTRIKKGLGTQNTLSSGKSIIIQQVKPTVLQSTDAYNIYWITKAIVDDYYVLAFDENKSHILTSDEYFIYASTNGEELVILGSGNMITLNNSDTNTGIQWKCKKVDISAISENGANAINEQSAFISLASKLNDGDSLVLQDMEIITIPETYLVKATPTGENATIKVGSTKFVDLSDYQLSYKSATDTEYTTLPQMSIANTSWQGKALLNFNLNATDGQALEDNQTIIAQTSDGSQFVFSSTYANAEFSAPTFTTNTYYFIDDDGEYQLITAQPDNWSNNWQYAYTKSGDDYINASPLNWGTKYSEYYIFTDGSFVVNTDNEYSDDITYFTKYSDTQPTLRVLSDYSILLLGGQNINTLVLVENQVKGISLFSYTNIDTDEWDEVIGKTPAADGSMIISATWDSTERTVDIPVTLLAGKYVITTTTETATNNTWLLICSLVADDGTELYLEDIDGNEDFMIGTKHYINLDINDDVVNKYTKLRLYLSATGSKGNKITLRVSPLWKYTVDSNVYKSYMNTIRELNIDSEFDYTHIVDDSVLIADPLDSITSTNFTSNGQCFMDSNHIFNKYTICRGENLAGNITIINKVK